MKCCWARNYHYYYGRRLAKGYYYHCDRHFASYLCRCLRRLHRLRNIRSNRRKSLRELRGQRSHLLHLQLLLRGIGWDYCLRRCLDRRSDRPTLPCSNSVSERARMNVIRDIRRAKDPGEREIEWLSCVGSYSVKREETSKLT